MSTFVERPQIAQARNAKNFGRARRLEHDQNVIVREVLIMCSAKKTTIEPHQRVVDVDLRALFHKRP